MARDKDRARLRQPNTSPTYLQEKPQPRGIQNKAELLNEGKKESILRGQRKDERERSRLLSFIQTAGFLFINIFELRTYDKNSINWTLKEIGAT